MGVSDQGSAATDTTNVVAPEVDGPAVGLARPADNVDPADLADEQLRSALELAFAVAVAGTRLKPAIPAPSSLRRYLKFQKLPSGALGPVRRAIEDDQAFRERTARVATDQLVGPLGMLWLARPDGWICQVSGLIALDAASDEATSGPRLDRSAERRREAAESALARARAEVVGLQSELRRVQNRVTDAETSAAVAVDEAAKLHAEAERLKVAGDRRRERARVAEQDRDRARSDLAGATERIADLERLLDNALAARQSAEAKLGPVSASAVHVVEAPAAKVAPMVAPVAPMVAPVAPMVAPAPPPQPVISDAWLAAGSTLAGRLTDAAAALGLLGADLASALKTFGSTPTATPTAPGPSRAARRPPLPPRPGPMAFPPSGVTPLSAGRSGSSGKRQPMAIPGGLLDDSTAVAFHLIRQPGVVTIVDGYNLAKLGWPDLALIDQRECCLDGIEDLVRRYGIRSHVVFDGASIVGVGSGRRLVRVTFTPTGVSADDEIRGLVRELPAEQAIVVVTNDREIVSGVRTVGANVVSSEQLLAVIRRSPR